MKRALTLAATLLAATVATTAPTDAAVTPAPRYWTGLVGRFQYAAAINCHPVPGAVTVLRLAAAADARGLSRGMSGNLVPAHVIAGRDYPDGRECPDSASGTQLYGSLADADMLRDRYGWRHGTSGLTGRPMTELSYAEKVEEACGGLRKVETWGNLRASAMFAAKYPADGVNVSQSDLGIIRKCGFSPWVRDYGNETTDEHITRADGTKIRTNLRWNLDENGFLRVVSINGGDTYMSRTSLLKDVRDAPPNSYTLFQTYRLVEGKVAGSHDCTNPDGVGNWTSVIEDYCWEDYRAVLDAVAASDMKPTDPLTVAQAWGLA